MQKALERIVVLGPLRSGTSLAAELVHRWGAYAGLKEELWQSDPNDQRGYGYMEYIPLQNLNDELLLGNDRVPPAVESMGTRAAEPKFKDQALRLLEGMDERARGNEAAAWIWKD